MNRIRIVKRNEIILIPELGRFQVNVIAGKPFLRKVKG